VLPLLANAGATLDPTRTYRYVLWREFTLEPKTVALWVMLNPSTADEYVNDPTIRRVRAFSLAWGFDACRIVNLFAYRSTDPDVLPKIADPVGPDNDRIIRLEAQAATKIIVAWGKNGALHGRSRHVRGLLAPFECWCFGTCENGEPKHPLYQHSSSQLVRW
jgi:hypothetical protein